MTKQEILNLVNQLPDDSDIELVISEESGDNWPVLDICINTLDNYPAELVFVLPENYTIQ